MLVCALTKQTRSARRAVIPTAMEPENANVERDKFWFLKSNNPVLSCSDSPYHRSTQSTPALHLRG